VYLAAQQRFEKLEAKEISAAAATVEKEYGKLVENVQPK